MSLVFLLLFIIILYAISSLRAPEARRTTRPCIHCGKSTSLRCSRCHEAYYCSSDHIALDWINHKSVCRRKVKDASKFDALLFPVDGGAPTMVEIPYTIKNDDGPKPYHDLASLRPWLPNGLEIKYVRRMGSHGPPLGRMLVVMYGGAFQVDGSPQNECIASLTRQWMHVPWAGNVLVLRQEGEVICDRYQSATMEDLEPMVKFFEEYEDFVPYGF
ncbi:hypothetical protein C8J57DRAFT_1179225 [Mycena rebaudengoi]|nr:hypothetical protein C8J57DRAFT_1179225 [Mycena rebaudengoi]